MTSVPAADVDGAVLVQVQKLLAAPELAARTWDVVLVDEYPICHVRARVTV